MLINNHKIPKKLKKDLINNPHWILNDNEILEHLINSEKNEINNNVIDLRDVYLKKIKSKLEDLSNIHNSTISAAYENYLSANNLHRCILKILEQKNLEDLLHILSTDIKKILQCSTLKLLFSGRTKITLNNTDFINVKKNEIQEIIKTTKLTNNSIIKLKNNYERLFITNFIKKNKRIIFSEAVLSLCTYLKNDNYAILILGSFNKLTFNEKNKTDYLSILAKVISIELDKYLMDYSI